MNDSCSHDRGTAASRDSALPPRDKTEPSGAAIFLTGATGMVGAFFLLRALRGGATVTALARPAAGKSAARRVDEVLRLQNSRLADWRGRLEIATGDITRPDLGLAPAEYDRLASTHDWIVHAAADTRFGDAVLPGQETVNLQGTRHLLEFAARGGARFAFLGTAYLTGLTAGAIPETPLPLSGTWKNGYEESKHRAENAAHDFCRTRGLHGIVLRPSIVSGHAATGAAISFQGIYPFLKLFDALAPRLRGRVTRFEADPRATVNLIPVDAVVDAIWNALRAGLPAGSVRHIAAAAPLTMGELRDCWQELFGIRVELVPAGTLQNTDSRLERGIRDAIGHYLPYLSGEPRFVMADPPAMPKLDAGYFHRALQHARRAEWGRPRESMATPPAPRADSFVTDYFQRHLPPKIGRRLIDNLRTLTAAFSIEFHDMPEPRSWHVRIRDGVLESVAPGGGGDCRYRTDVNTFESVAGAMLSPQQAFFNQRVDIEGDMETGLRVATALAEFFQRYPCHRETPAPRAVAEVAP